MGCIQGNKHFIASPSTSKSKKNQGFTLLELLVAIAVVGIITAIALPSLNNFMVKMRVDNEITELQRLLLTARNMAINTGKNTTVCPLDNGVCTANWGDEISVFTNGSNTFENNQYIVTADALTDTLVKVKSEINTGDRLQFANASVVYTPSGQLNTASGTFSFCPQGEGDESRGVTLALSGRSYLSTDIDDDGKDEDRNGNDIVCI